MEEKVEVWLEYKAKITRNGNSHYVLVPINLVKKLNLRVGDIVKVRISKLG